MTTLLTIEKAELEGLRSDVAAIKSLLESVSLSPIPEWMNEADYAAYIDMSRSTVTRRIKAGEVETRMECGVRMIRTRG